MATFLVTGGAGFIGSHLASAVHQNGDRVRVLDDLSSGFEENLEAIGSGVDVVRGDVADRKAVGRAMDGVDYVLHHAALASVPQSVENPDLNHRSNVDGTLNLLLAARENGVKRFVLASSAAIYGDDPSSPKRESMDPAPLSPYAAAKLIGEVYCSQFTAAGWVDAVCLRYFNIFGPRQDPASDYAAVVPIFIRKLLDGETPLIHGDGEQTRDFTYVDNVVRANLLALEKPDAPGGVFNIGCGGSFSVNELFRLIADQVSPGASADHTEPRAGDVRVSSACIDKARETLDYDPVVGFEEGLTATCRWFRENPDRARKAAR